MLITQVFARWEKFESDVAQSKANPNPSVKAIADHFPFTRYFADVPPPLFKVKNIFPFLSS